MLIWNLVPLIMNGKQVREKAEAYGREISGQKQESGEESMRVQPELVVNMYKDFIMPLTKKVEVRNVAPIVSSIVGQFLVLCFSDFSFERSFMR